MTQNGKELSKQRLIRAKGEPRKEKSLEEMDVSREKKRASLESVEIISNKEAQYFYHFDLIQ